MNMCARSIASFASWIFASGEGAFLGDCISLDDGVATTTSLGVDREAGEAAIEARFENLMFP